MSVVLISPDVAPSSAYRIYAMTTQERNFGKSRMEIVIFENHLLLISLRRMAIKSATIVTEPIERILRYRVLKMTFQIVSLAKIILKLSAKDRTSSTASIEITIESLT